ncbi:MAG: putative signal transducing protein [Bosea sp. (in: a-proteobacteria)]|uniref:putative signal transducing protein n=1 Tax=Bosea sp. (in: a-proteobacteria) TaxID=1871050 RepID=UPI003F7C2829
MIGDFRNHRHVRAGARQNHRIDALHVIARQRHQRLDASLARFPFLKGDDDTQWTNSRRTRTPRGAPEAIATTVAWDASPRNRTATPQARQIALASGAALRLHGGMHELVRTNDLVLLGALEALLSAADLDCLIADQHISALEGMIGAFPRRLLVREEDARRARALLIQAGYGAELRDD